MFSHAFHRIRTSLMLSSILVCAGFFGITSYAHASEEVANDSTLVLEEAQGNPTCTSVPMDNIDVKGISEDDVAHGMRAVDQEAVTSTSTSDSKDAIDSKPQTDADESPLKPMTAGWYQTADGDWYYFTSITGKPKTGWLAQGGTWYWLNPDKNGLMATNTWIDDGSAEYFMSASGAMKTGWHQDEDGTWYYLDASGRKHVGWAYLGNTWYYLDPDDGAMKTGRYKVGNTWYVSSASGAMYANSWAPVGSDWYYATASGAPLTGWLHSGGCWYWLQPEKDGLMAANASVEDGGITYYLTASGAMKTGWHKDGDTWYYLNASGRRHTGWVYVNAWYYLDPAADGAMKTGRYKVGDTWYVSRDSGAMYANSWAPVGSDWYYATASGAPLTGWLHSGDAWYWLDPEKDGLMIADANKTIEGALYSFDDNGAMRTFCKIDTDDGTYRYATGSGAALQIGVYKNGKAILQDARGNVLTGWHKLANRWFYGEDKTGILHTGWLELGDTKYYLDASGAMLTGTHTIAGKSYYFAASGALTERPYMNASASERLLAAAASTPYQGNGYCAKWTNSVYVNAGYPHPDGNACDLYWKYCNISNLDFMEPGMIIGVPSHTRSSLGRIYGHVAIYMGDGLVRHNINTVETTSLSSWLAYYQTTYAAKCGWAFY